MSCEYGFYSCEYGFDIPMYFQGNFCFQLDLFIAVCACVWSVDSQDVDDVERLYDSVHRVPTMNGTSDHTRYLVSRPNLCPCAFVVPMVVAINRAKTECQKGTTSQKQYVQSDV